MRRFISSSLIVGTSLLSACSGGSEGTSTGNPMVTLKISSYDSSLAIQKTEVGAASLSSLTFCFKRLRFKTAGESTDTNPELDSDNIDYELGEVAISTLGTTLEGVQIPAGDYERVEFDLENDCASGKSLQLTNSSGSFSTSDRITIKFEGSFTHTQQEVVLTLGIQQIISALNTVTANSEIKNKAESVSGDF